jgi:tetratricopeptide (TPR) repeat protein
MKTYINYLMILCSCLAFSAQAATTNKGCVTVDVTTFAQKGGEVLVNMNINAAPRSIDSRQSLTVTPMLVTENNEYQLPVVIFNGRNRQHALERAVAMNNVSDNGGVYKIVEVNKHTSTNVNYQISIPYTLWMQNAALVIEEDLCNCGGLRGNKSKSIASEALVLEFVPHQIEPSITFIIPEVEQTKNRNATGQAYLNYKDGKSKIVPDFKNNRAELNKIDTLVLNTKNDPNASIQSIHIKGYASPEGNFAFNERLSKERAIAMKLYMQSKYGFSSTSIETTWFGEDWEGLRKLVEASDLSNKEAILAIINSSSKPDAKDRELKALDRGVTYKMLYDEFYPKLRRSDYVVDYIVKGFTVEEGIVLINTQPDHLSLNELFLIANTYPKGSDKYNNVFNIAVKQFPNDPTANINAAAIALDKKDKEKARYHLMRFTKHPDAWNNLGILYLLDGDTDTASQYFQKAKDKGEEEAILNIEQLKLYQENLENGFD